MAREKPSSPGGKLIAVEILKAIKSNVDDMKNNGGGRKAEANELIGNEDLANAIALAVEKALSQSFTFNAPLPAGVWGALSAGPASTPKADLIGLKYVFI